MTELSRNCCFAKKQLHRIQPRRSRRPNQFHRSFMFCLVMHGVKDNAHRAAADFLVELKVPNALWIFCRRDEVNRHRRYSVRLKIPSWLIFSPYARLDGNLEYSIAAFDAVALS